MLNIVGNDFFSIFQCGALQLSGLQFSEDAVLPTKNC